LLNTTNNIFMKHSKTFITLSLAGMFLIACSGNNKKKSGSDSSTTSTMTDSTGGAMMRSDTSVKPADSTHSFRNDRGTDSVSAGKSVPAQP
jgi:hypothetical protein